MRSGPGGGCVAGEVRLSREVPLSLIVNSCYVSCVAGVHSKLERRYGCFVSVSTASHLRSTQGQNLTIVYACLGEPFHDVRFGCANLGGVLARVRRLGGHFLPLPWICLVIGIVHVFCIGCGITGCVIPHIVVRVVRAVFIIERSAFGLTVCWRARYRPVCNRFRGLVAAISRIEADGTGKQGVCTTVQLTALVARNRGRIWWSR